MVMWAEKSATAADESWVPSERTGIIEDARSTARNTRPEDTERYRKMVECPIVFRDVTRRQDTMGAG